MPAKPRPAIPEVETFRRRVKAALALKGWTITELADHVGASRTATFAAVNHGHNKGVRAAIAKLLSVQDLAA